MITFKYFTNRSKNWENTLQYKQSMCKNKRFFRKCDLAQDIDTGLKETVVNVVV